MNKKLLMGIIAGICVVALVLGLVLGLNNCAGTTEDPTDDTGSSPTAEPTQKPTKAPKPSKETDPPEPGGTSYYSGMPDYGWYDKDEIYEEYTLYTADEFMAFVDLVNTGTNFQGITIKLASNLVFNNGDASVWTRDDVELMKWTPIGSKEANAFRGTIDGQGYSISGLYGVKGRDNGFILYAIKATVKNLAIVNSYFCNTGGNQKDAQVLGGFVGRAYGCTLQNLYTDVILEGGGYHTGGIAGFARDTWTLSKVEDAKECLIDSCVFAGTIKGAVGANVGGILGGTDGVTVSMISNCLNLGTLESNSGSIGGIAGALSAESKMINCVNAGKIVSTDKNSDRAALVGKPAGTCTVQNSYFANIPGAKPFGSGTPANSGIMGVERKDMKGSNATKNLPMLDFTKSWTTYKDGYPIPTGVTAMYDVHKKDVEEDAGNGGALWKNQTGSSDTGKADTSWYVEGEKTFTLTTADQLYGLAKLVNDGKTNFAGVTIKLGADIIINDGDASKWTDVTTGLRVWKPIGTSAAKHFAGTLDGQGHYISGLYSRMDRDNGLILYAMNATVKNLAIVNSYFENYGREHANGYLSAQVLASFVGRSYGSKLQNLYSDARIIIPETAVGFNTGGIAGFAKSNGTQSEIAYGDSIIENCVFAGTIVTNNEKDDLTGGILGGTDGSYATIKNCLFRGAINAKSGNIGGIAGRMQNASVMEDCVSVGNINSKNALLGAVDAAAEVKDCYYLKATGVKAIGSGTPKTHTSTALESEKMTGVEIAANMSGLDFKSAWTALKDDYPIPTGVKAMYAAHKKPIPTLDKETGGESGGESGGETGGESGGSHVAGTPDTSWYKDGETSFTLTTADQLFGFAQLVNGGNTFEGVTIKLGADITINEGNASAWRETAPARKWTPIGSGSSAYFAGTFDGQGHYISGLYTAEKQNNGLFGWTANAEIKNLAVINSYFSTVGRDNGGNGQMLATFVARAHGTTLKNLYSNAIVHYAADDTHKGDWCTAGIVGILTSPAIGQESEAQESGAILVTKQGVLENCVFAGAIITDGTNTSQGAAVGGLLGSANSRPITIKNCMFVGEIISNDKQVGGIAGILANGGKIESSVVIGKMTSVGSVSVWGAVVGECGGTVSIKNCYYGESLNLALYGKKATVNDESTNVELSEDKMRGTQVSTTMSKLPFGDEGWTAQENDYPVPTAVLAMYNAHKAPHVHDWAESWTSNETGHWHNCGNVGCDITDPTEKKDYAAHDYTDAKDKDCNTCGYVREIPDANDGATDGSLSKHSGYIGGDNSWYKPESGATEYTLTNADQLYGFAYLVNVQGVKFEGITIKLGVNVVINEGDASTWGTTPPELKWRPIGTKANYFAGTFDGQGHYISGMYSCEKENNGMFAWTGNATIKNLAIVNSYFKSTGRDSDGQAQFLGSFAARAYGTVMKNLYTDAIVEYAGTGTKGDWCTGGIAACVTGPSSSAQDGITITNQGSIENCVFAGTILTGTAGGTGSGVGGIMGYSNGKSVIIKNCLFIGSIESNDKNVGGIAGAVASGSTIEACVSAGTLTATVQNPTNWGSVVGEVSGTCSVKNNYYSEALNLPLYGKKGTVNDEATNTALSAGKLKGEQVTTTMANLTYSDLGWTAQEGDYPVPSTMKIMVNALRKLSADAAAPVINTQPTMDNLTVDAESVDGGKLSYQWYKSTDGTTFTAIDGATSATYTHDPNTVGNVWYKCEVTNTNNNTTSSVKSAKVESAVVKVHNHMNEATMSKDENGHWYACTDADCDVAPENLPSYEAHRYDDDSDPTCNVAECGYERHIHNWGNGWTTTDTHAWHECGAADCDITENELKNGYHSHVFDTASGNAICETCSYERVVSYFSGTPDKSWYDDNKTEFVLTSADQFYALIHLSNTEGKTFEGKTIKLAVNIVIAQGDAGTWNKDNAPAYTWTPMGSAWANCFSGTLDGQNHYISGLYSRRNSNNALIYCLQNGEIKNLAIVNSYFENIDNEVLGTFVGKGRGAHLENLYSDAILVGGTQQIGGIAAYIQCRDYTGCRAAYVKNSVFAGSITDSTSKYIGGIVGSDNNGSQDGVGYPLIENCLYVGSINVKTSSYVGGIAGRAKNGLVIRGCLSAGTVVGINASGTGNALVGWTEGNGKTDNVSETVAEDKCYYVTDLLTKINGGYTDAAKFEITDVSGVTAADAKGVNALNNMPLLAGSWTARENDYPVPTSLAALIQKLPVNVAFPVINTNPGNFAYENAEATVTDLLVTASRPDNGTLTYQWYVNSTNSNVGGTLIEGATQATYTPSLSGMNAGDAKYYYCVVTNTNNELSGIKVRSTVSNVACIHIHLVDTANYTGHDATQHWSACTVSGCGAASGHTAHTGEGKTCSTCGFLKANYYAGGSDKTWYTSNPNASEYVLTTPAQLYGLAELVNNDKVTFSGKTIKLGADMVINAGDAYTWSKTTTGLYKWTPIGNAVVEGTSWKFKVYFAGTLDGQNHYISGLYGVQGRDQGFMTYTVNATIKNLSILNSYFENDGTSASNGQVLGTFVARGFGVTLKNLYSDAILVCSVKDYHTGGIAGFAKGNGTVKDANSPQVTHSYGAATIDSVVYAGTIKNNTDTDGELVGGILGGTDGGPITITNSLFKGIIYTNDNYVGGIVGRIYPNSVVNNCISAGVINKKDGKTVASIVGDFYNAGSFTVTHCFATENQGLELLGRKHKGDDAVITSTGTATLADAAMKGDAALTNMPKLFEGQEPAWKVTDGYPIPVGVIIP